MHPKDWSPGNRALARALKRGRNLGNACELFAAEVFRGVKPTPLMIELLHYYFQGQVEFIQSEMAQEQAA